jgi:ABC-type glycerol-3-phosphate transport system permease component
MSVAAEAVPRPSKKRGLAWWKGAILYAILVPGAILFVAPLVWMISASFQPVGDMFSWPPQWIPENPTVEGYKLFFGIVDPGELQGRASRAAIGVERWFINSAIVATSITVLQLFFNSLAAYVFAKRKFPGRDAIFLLFLATMMVPSTVTLIPNYLVLKHIPLFGGNDIWGLGGHGMLDSYYGLILPSAVSAFGIFLLRQYMRSIPDERHRDPGSRGQGNLGGVTTRTTSAPDVDAFFMFRGKEFAAMLDWMRDYNLRVPDERKVRFYGVDDPYNDLSRENVIRYLSRHSPARVAGVRSLFQTLAAEDPK